MITANAISSIEWLFDKSVRENCSLGSEDRCTVTSLNESAEFSKPGKRKLVVLNISSYIFRIVALIEFQSDASTVEQFAKILRSSDMKLEGQALLDAYAEFTNMICGAVNRKLCTEFRHAGMSTPFFLDSSCASYISMLNPATTRSYEVVINEMPHFRLTLCVCVARDKTLDFNIEQSDDQEESATGELEFF